MFCNLNFLMKYLALVSSALSTGIIVDTIRPLSTGQRDIIVDLYIFFVGNVIDLNHSL